ncbi:MAG: hypothetical protein DWQ30_25175 [Acidobacteria bacterium]|nr:MAG: hypothetical protein DWQ30_25175 [Acidobacteriota bacterium]
MAPPAPRAILGGLLVTLVLAGCRVEPEETPAAGSGSAAGLDGLTRSAAETTVRQVVGDVDPRTAEVQPTAALPRQQLRAMAYTAGTFDPDAELEGVLLHDHERAWPGLNFFTSRDLPAAFLMDMDGRMVHRWRRRGGGWQHAELLPDGQVIVLVRDQAIFQVDAASEIVWHTPLRAHHDHSRSSDGRIFVLTNRLEEIPEIHPRHKILADYVTVLSAQGEVLEEIGLIPLLRRSPIAALLPYVADLDLTREGEAPEDVEIDYLHANHIEIFDGSVPGELYRSGLALLSLRQINTIAIVDLETAEVLWFWGPFNLVRQHHPTLLPDGNLLVFNNRLKTSQIVEVDPRTFDVEWTYEDGEFFSLLRGSNQRLSNGNTLITESDTGYVFEVTAEGDEVWRFANLQVDDKGVRSAIWRMVRFAPEELPFVTGPDAGSRTPVEADQGQGGEPRDELAGSTSR